MKSREEWWNFFDLLAEAPFISGLNCQSSCKALCCPDNTLTPGKIGSFVIFLPYEYEYIESKSSIEFNNLEMFWVEIKDANTPIRIPWTRNCPFKKTYECSEYQLRPVDCKMFPILVNPSECGPEFKLNEMCPILQNLNKDFYSYFQNAWVKIYTHIPSDWWKLLQDIESKRE